MMKFQKMTVYALLINSQTCIKNKVAARFYSERADSESTCTIFCRQTRF